MARIFSITALVCLRISRFVVPISSTSTPSKVLSGNLLDVPETYKNGPATLRCGNLPLGLALSDNNLLSVVFNEKRLWLGA